MSQILFLIVLLTLGSTQATLSPKISPNLVLKFNQDPTTNIIITFATGTSAVLSYISENDFPDRDTLLFSLATALDINSVQSQSSVRNFLATTNFTSDPLWVTDQLWVKDSTVELVSQLAEFPEVIEIFEDELTFSFSEPSSPILTGRSSPLAEWNLEKVKAEEAVTLLKNVSTNIPTIRVCTIDTGVRVTHESLRGSYLGEYGWFDPGLRSDLPNDMNGHGTHVTGTIAGLGGIGVYPDAKWMSCKGCATNFCSMYDLIRCGQWVLCPSLPNGSRRDCSKAPHLVSNSWAVAYTPETTWFDDVVRAWHVGRVVPVFGIGNDGPNCGTVGYPGSIDVIGVGATTTTDAIAPFSSVGPSIHGVLKPDVTAPGQNVLSAAHTGDNEYRVLSGTSMA